MDRVLTKSEVEAQLRAKADEINRRIDALQGEVAGAPASLKEAIAKNPFAGVGGAVVAGLLVGLLFGGSKKKRKNAFDFDDAGQHRALIDSYVHAIAAEAGKAAKAGADMNEAVQKALRDRVPIIMYSSDGGDRHGFLRESMDFALKTALGFAVKIGIDFLTAHLHLEGLAEPLQAQGGTDAAAPVAAFTSED